MRGEKCLVLYNLQNNLILELEFQKNVTALCIITCRQVCYRWSNYGDVSDCTGFHWNLFLGVISSLRSAYCLLPINNRALFNGLSVRINQFRTAWRISMKFDTDGFNSNLSIHSSLHKYQGL